jgi:hypothetical protein
MFSMWEDAGVAMGLAEANAASAATAAAAGGETVDESALWNMVVDVESVGEIVLIEDIVGSFFWRLMLLRDLIQMWIFVVGEMISSVPFFGKRSSCESGLADVSNTACEQNVSRFLRDVTERTSGTVWLLPSKAIDDVATCWEKAIC